jgi:hypothetical protein
MSVECCTTNSTRGSERRSGIAHGTFGPLLAPHAVASDARSTPPARHALAFARAHPFPARAPCPLITLSTPHVIAADRRCDVRHS